MRVLLILFCCFYVVVSAQAPYLQRTGSENTFRRIDPLGSLPTTFNNPLPFSYGFSTTSPVIFKYPEADYFISTADNLWDYECTHQFVYDESGALREELHVNKFTGELKKRIIYDRNKNGFLKAVNEFAGSSGTQIQTLTTRRLLSYEEQSGIMTSDSTLDFDSGSWQVKGIRIMRDPDNKLKYAAVYSRINETTYHQGFFEFSYKGDLLDEIVQYYQDEKGDRLAPVYRFYNLTGTLVEPFQITGYTSAWMENSSWMDFRIDKSSFGFDKKIFEGKLLSGTAAGTTIENIVDIDDYKNVTRISQKNSVGDFSEQTGELTYELSYEEGNTTPSIITTTYRDEFGNKKNSLRVVGHEKVSFISATTPFSIAVFPNPATDLITVQWEHNNSTPLVFELVTVTGILVAKITPENTETTRVSLSLKGIAPGFYTLNGYCGDRFISAPLIILERK